MVKPAELCAITDRSVEALVESTFEHRLFVRLREYVGDRSTSGLGIDAECFYFVTGAPFAPELHFSGETGMGMRHSAVVDRAVTGEFGNGGFDLNRRQFAPD